MIIITETKEQIFRWNERHRYFEETSLLLKKDLK
ncbi:hypothetical protein BVRB_9g224100 [Beta vulgaris subsp. vulgaris]|nr:hypothetical protein BVRB_9g224100 [Beta vulgaris subsp. vulgaris]